MRLLDLLGFEQKLAGKKILLTGHTGFTGSWACLWLKAIGAEVAGFSLPAETDPNLYSILGLDSQLKSKLADIADYTALAEFFSIFQPELVLHLAAQPLVRRSYREPVATFMTNTLGTAHVLEAARLTPSVKAVVCVTTDKVYKNNEWPWPYRENDPLGGKDPYSASKAAAEMVIQSYSASYGKTDGSGLAIATARGGNIVGGGDWSEDRLIPDFVRAVINGTKLSLRYPHATRPWQHVLALVQGYLMLLAGLLDAPEKYTGAWNLGPHDSQNFTVKEVLELLAQQWQRPELEFLSNALPEAGMLALDSSLAHNLLKWLPTWGREQVIAETAAWYKAYYQDPTKAYDFSLMQLQRWRQSLAPC